MKPASVFGAILLGITVALVGALPAGAGTMYPSSVYFGGWIPRDVKTADFNGDGLVDLAVLSQGQDGMATGYFRALLGNGDGSFRETAAVDLGDMTSRVMPGDLNGDGRSDVVVDMQDSPFKVLLSNGDGSFQAAPDVPSGGIVPRVVLADFTSDSKIDLLIIRGTTTSTIEVMRGVGDGTFTPPPGGPVSVSPITSLAQPGDLNNDGKMDFVTQTNATTVRVYLGTGSGTFTSLIGTTVSANGQLHLVDLDRDGKLDLVHGTGNLSNPGNLALYRGNGAGAFFFPAAWTMARPQGVEDLASGDINGDGWPDLVVTNFLGPMVTFGTGGGNQAVHEVIQSQDSTFRAAVGDFDGEGALDLAVVGWDAETVKLYRGDADGNYLRLQTNPVPLYFRANTRTGVVADFNGDGIDDLAGTSCQGEDDCRLVGVAPGLAAGWFGPATFTQAGYGPNALIAPDVNGDGKLDLVSVNFENEFELPEPGTLSVLLGVGNGTFLPQTLYPAGWYPDAVASGDLDGDGDLDLAAVMRGDVHDSKQGGIVPYRGNGDGTFVPLPMIDVGPEPVDVEIAELTGDGNLDIVTVSTGLPPIIASELSILPGNGNMTFGTRLVRGTGSELKSVNVGDLDGDGDSDLVAADGGAASLGGTPTDNGQARIFRNTGGGNFTALGVLTGGHTPLDSWLQDLNDDGALDLVVESIWSDDIAMFPGRGDATFLSPARYARKARRLLAIARFDPGPLPDLILTDTFGTVAQLNIGRATPEIHVGGSPTLVRWSGVPLCGGYDVVKGTLSTLRTSGFSVAVTGCPHPGGLTQSFNDSAVPAVGNGFFYIARARKPTGGAGTYDSGGAGQVAPRDESIDLSGLSCP